MEAVTVVFVERVECAGFDFVELVGRQVFESPLTLETVNCFKVILIPEDLIHPSFEDGIGNCHSHTVFLMQQSATRPVFCSYLAFCPFEILFGSYDHHSAPLDEMRPPRGEGAPNDLLGVIGCDTVAQSGGLVVQ